ncbi:MAG TPA: response regulator transcription factor, partial [Sphingomicrobium sp.]
MVDDHPLLRAGLVETIRNEAGMRIVGEAADGAEAIDRFISHQPDVVIMDIAMPNMDGIQALQAIRAINPGAKVIMLTTYQFHAQIRRAVTAGA